MIDEVKETIRELRTYDRNQTPWKAVSWKIYE